MDRGEYRVMRFYLYTQTSPLYGETTQIICVREDRTEVAVLGGNSELAREYEAWIAEGNEPEEWSAE